MQINESGLEALFTLENDKSGVVEEPPFHILVLGDWSADADGPELSKRRPKEIDRDNFDDVLAGYGTRLLIALESGAEVGLEFKEIGDFHPDNIYRNVPLFSELRDLRQRLGNEDTFYLATREIRESFNFGAANSETIAEEEASAEADVGDDLLNAILTKPSGGGVANRKPENDLGRLVADLVRPHLVSVDDTERITYLAAVDSASTELMRSIIHHPRFRELEAAWRGLNWMVRRTETSSDLKIFLLDLRKDELLADLGSKEALSETQLFRYASSGISADIKNDPLSLMIGNYAFSPEIEDIAGLIRIGQIAGSAVVPFVSHMRPDVLGIRSLAESTEPAVWRDNEDSRAAKLWAALCDQSSSVYLGMTIPRFLARLPYGSETDPLETFYFEEFEGTVPHDDYVWSNSALIVGQLFAASFAQHGWQMGARIVQDVEGLPVHVFKDGTETVFKPCAEAALSDRATNVLIDKGLMPLVTYKNTDRARIAMIQSVAGTGLKGRW